MLARLEGEFKLIRGRLGQLEEVVREKEQECDWLKVEKARVTEEKDTLIVELERLKRSRAEEQA